MRIALLGGSGRIGQLTLSWALRSGHKVTALARNPRSIGAADGLTILTGDALDPVAVADVVAGADAVVSALGSRGVKTPGLLASAAENITASMTSAGSRRLICVSAAGAFIDSDPDMGALTKMILPRLLAKPFADVQQMEAAVVRTDLAWTLVRPTRLVNAPLTGHYRVRPDYAPRGGRKISRADVAHFIAAVLTEDNWICAKPALAY